MDFDPEEGPLRQLFFQRLVRIPAEFFNQMVFSESANLLKAITQISVTDRIPQAVADASNWTRFKPNLDVKTNELRRLALLSFATEANWLPQSVQN